MTRLTKKQLKQNEQVINNIRTIGNIARRLRLQGLDMAASLKEARRLFEQGIRE